MEASRKGEKSFWHSCEESLELVSVCLNSRGNSSQTKVGNSKFSTEIILKRNISIKISTSCELRKASKSFPSPAAIILIYCDVYALAT